MTVSKIPLGEYQVTKDGKVIKYCLENITSQVKMDEALEHMINYFLPREPLSKYLDVCSDEPSKNSVKKLWAEALQDGHAIGAYLLNSNGTIGRLIGTNIIIVSNKNAPHDEILQLEGEQFQIIFKTFKSLMERVDVYDRYGVDEYLEGLGLSVHPEYHGCNLGYRILESREKLCKALGLNVAVTMFTAASSQHIARKLGYETLVEIDYDEVKIEGRYPYRGIWEKMKEKKFTLMALEFK
ncbi:uncharacterized protein LOC106664543 [Cimex lectularius]|uniref:N-acetyltransferase domain-containing protein n=1 Tax=Cimex lectularius TaxID=79782 RepID=A0A8I6RGK3_CIMLE|nr:uncharacterized protein LOC106664543 [Cimex lectularius]